MDFDQKSTINILIIAVAMFAFWSPSMAQNAHRSLRKGDKSYESGAFMQAEEAYRKALSEKSTYKSHYNLGNAIYQQDRYEEAVDKYESALQNAKKLEERQQAHYNLGNAYAKSGDYEQAIESYKNALKLDPEDLESRNNLQQAILQRMIQQQQQQQQQQDNDQENQQQNNQQESSPQEPPSGSEEQSDQGNTPEEQPVGNEEPQQENPQSGNLSKEDAEKLLQIIENEERKVQEKMRKQSATKNKPVKDW